MTGPGLHQRPGHYLLVDATHHLFLSSRSLRNTVFGSGLSGRSGKASRNRLITEGLVSRKNVLISRSSAKVVTSALPGFCCSICGSIDLALLLSGSRSNVKARLRAM